MEGRCLRQRAGEWDDDSSEDAEEQDIDVINISDDEQISQQPTALGPSQSVSSISIDSKATTVHSLRH